MKMLILYYLFILLQNFLSESANTVKFSGPVHVNPDGKYEFSCYLSTKEPVQIIEILFINDNKILSVMPGNDCELERTNRKFVSNCKHEDGILKYTMQFNQTMEGIYICRISSKGVLLMEKMNILFNASVPIFNMIKKEIYYVNETIAPTCLLENNKNSLGVFIVLTYKNGHIVEINPANKTNTISKVNTEFYLNISMNGASLGCGIQYEYSQYIENYTALNISYQMEEIQLSSVKTHYYYNDSVFCLTDGNPNPVVQWQVVNGFQSMNDTITGSRLTFSELLGNRTFECTAKQNFKNETITFRKTFTFDVILFTTTISPTPSWTNITLIFVGDQLSKSNVSQHHWEIAPKWVGFINGSIFVNDKEMIYFNNTDVIQYPAFIFDVVITSFSITYKISEPALHGMYKCRILNKHIESLENETIFIRGENPTIILIKNERNYTVTCFVNDLGSPSGILRIFKRFPNGHVGAVAEGTNKTYNITQNIYLDWTDNDATIFCVNIISNYYNWMSNSILINITFPVRDMEITPNIPEYGNGDIIRCNAKGNPLPVIIWSSNINDSFNLRTNPDVIQLTPRSNFNVNYTCTASNDVDGKSYFISKSITIYGSSDEFIEFSAMPPFVGSLHDILISCRVRNLNSVNVMNIKDNDEDMISYDYSNGFIIRKMYRNKVLNNNIKFNATTLSLLVNFKNDSVRTIGCAVVFQSNYRLEKRIELRNMIDINYEQNSTVSNGSVFNVSCLQRLRNGLVMKIGVSSNNNNHFGYKRISNVSDLIKFSFDVTSNMHGSQLYCLLEDSNIELGRKLGEELFIVYVSQELQINPYKSEYSQSETIECIAQGRPKPKITWNHIIGNNNLTTNESILILLNGDGEYVYECSAESIYKTERAFVIKKLKFLIKNSKSFAQHRVELNFIWITVLLITHIFKLIS